MTASKEVTTAPFKVRANDLEDGSVTFDVLFIKGAEVAEVANPVSDTVAVELATSLNKVYRGFQLINERCTFNQRVEAGKFADGVNLALEELLRRLT